MYLSVTLWNLYQMMYPLALVDLSKYKFPQDYVHPLWRTTTHDKKKVTAQQQQQQLHMRVYLSPKPILSTNMAFTSSSWAQIASPKDHGIVILWDAPVHQRSSLTKSFLLAQPSQAQDDPSFRYAQDWLNAADAAAINEITGGFLSAVSAASGQGIESTSFLLTLYQKIARQVSTATSALFSSKTQQEQQPTEASVREQIGLMDQQIVQIPKTMWKALVQSNSTVYVTAFVVRTPNVDSTWPPKHGNETAKLLSKAGKAKNLLTGQVDLVKYEAPHHVEKPKRILYHDILFGVRYYLLGHRQLVAPWNMAETQPEAYQAYSRAKWMQENHQGYPYWKPEVSIKLVREDQSYPVDYAAASGMPIVRMSQKSQDHPQGYAFLPALHVDELGMTSEKYVPVNSTVTALPLRISFDQSSTTSPSGNNVDSSTTAGRRQTASGGGMSPARWRLLSHMAEAIEKQKELGFEQSDIDDIKRLIADTNVTLLAITMLASTLHLLFEFLTFKNEVSFWNSNKDLTGLSVRSLFLDMIGQTVILFYLIEKESSLLMTVPSAIGCLIALWKCQKAAGLKYVKVRDPSSPCPWWDWIPRTLTGYELRAIRLEASAPTKNSKTKLSANDESKRRLVAMTIESDRLATRYLGALLLPLTIGYTIYSLVFLEHRSWYSWLITSLATAVYALGFVLMTPQLFLNWKMKSVSHLPWKVLVFKTLSTFIDDLFSCEYGGLFFDHACTSHCSLLFRQLSFGCPQWLESVASATM